MVPFYQGQLDCFCAGYAVMNALRLLHGLPLTEARAIFNSMLVDLARNPNEFAATAMNATDHIDWVTCLLGKHTRQPRSLRFEQPFAHARTLFSHKGGYTLDAGKRLVNPSGDVSPERLWTTIADWLGPTVLLPDSPLTAPRAVIFRFHRYMAPAAFPVVSHWSMAGELGDDDSIRLSDASLEPSAVHAIPRRGFVTGREEVDADRLIQIEPGSLFLLERR